MSVIGFSDGKHVDRLRAGAIIEPEPLVFGRYHDGFSSLNESGVFDLGIRKKLAGPAFTVVNQDVDVRWPAGLQVNLKVITRAQHAAFVYEDFDIISIGLFSLADDVHPEIE